MVVVGIVGANVIVLGLEWTCVLPLYQIVPSF